MSSRTPRFTCTARSRRKRSPTWPSSWIKTRPRLSPSGQVWSYLLSPPLPPQLSPPPRTPPKNNNNNKTNNNKQRTTKNKQNKTSKQNAAPCHRSRCGAICCSPRPPTPATQTSGQVCSSLSACLSVCLCISVSLPLSITPPPHPHLRTPATFQSARWHTQHKLFHTDNRWLKHANR